MVGVCHTVHRSGSRLNVVYLLTTMTPRDEVLIAALRNPDTLLLGSRPAHRDWQRPTEIELFRGRIRWSAAQKYRRTRADGSMLERFVSLPSGTDAAIVRFARRYGPLGLCAHGAPASHSPHCRPVCDESLEDWRFYSRSALAMLRIGAAIALERLPDAADWQALYKKSGRVAPWWHRDINTEKSALEDVLNEWLSYAMPRFEVNWPLTPHSRPALEMAPAGMAGALVLQLVLRVGRKDTMAACDNCGALYSSQRAPKTGQRHFCPDCRRNKIPEKYAHADYRAAKKGTK